MKHLLPSKLQPKSDLQQGHLPLVGRCETACQINLFHTTDGIAFLNTKITMSMTF